MQEKGRHISSSSQQCSLLVREPPGTSLPAQVPTANCVHHHKLISASYGSMADLTRLLMYGSNPKRLLAVDDDHGGLLQAVAQVGICSAVLVAVIL
eukprot:767868-Hanusia_phi.AAC.3